MPATPEQPAAGDTHSASNPTGKPVGSTSGPQVGLFVSCLVDLYRPNVGFAAISLLERAGCKVSVPASQTCCGQPAYNTGDVSDTAAIARATIAAFEEFEYIVVPSGSCAGMLRKHYPELLQDDEQWADRAHSFSEKVFELTSFLQEVVKLDDINARFDARVTYHDSCSGLRELGIKQQPRNLLAKVDGVVLNEMESTDVCCGFGGTFCVKYPDISERMVSDKVALAEQTGADVLLGGDLGCLLNISGRLSRLDRPMRVYHVAEVLADMTDVPALAVAETGFVSQPEDGSEKT